MLAVGQPAMQVCRSAASAAWACSFLSDESETAADKAKLLRLISHEEVEAGGLDRFGERVFTDGRVRAALADLASNPPAAWLDAINAGLLAIRW